MKASKQHKITVEIMQAILEHENGYGMREIVDKKLAENCEGTDLWDDIKKILEKNNVR